LDRPSAVERLCRKGIVAVVRADRSDQLLEAAEALLAGGVDCIEITMTTPDALSVIERCRAELGDRALVGVGSVTGGPMARNAVSAGAQFVVSPVFKEEILAAAHQAECPCVPGALTPTEILRCHDAGADLVKVFPAGHFGAKYFKDVLAPLPFLRLTPTGGVDLDTAGDFIRAGAATLGVGSSLVSRSALAAGDFDGIRRLAGQFVKTVAEARAAGKK
jgi:2-dehydro-3-deoxyphosphogluconate aldolase/(4S)-4-hydroxy-2-oxoglutarate aldolase